MGYNIYIGNATPFWEATEGEERMGWRVEPAKSDDAPTFPNDGMTANTNSRYPSYTGWDNFCHAAGIHPLFYDQYEGLLREHSGIQILTKKHHLIVKGALESFKIQHPTTVPGFKGEPLSGEVEPFAGDEFSHTLARLIWLEWWMRWALGNCEHPAVQNS